MLLYPPSYGYQSSYQVMAHEIDPQKRITAHALLQLMQEASLQNAIMLKVSLWDLEEKQLSWVLLRKHIDVQRWPELGRSIRIMTYPAGFNKIFAYRDFIAYDEEDNLVASASSTWTLMDMKTRRAVRIPTFMEELVPTAPEDVLPRSSSKLSKPAEWTNGYETSIRFFDLDWNGHVNNLTLVKYLLEATSTDLWHTHCISNLSFQIKAEVLLGDHIEVQYQVENDQTFYRMMKDGTTEVASAIATWSIT